MKLNKNNIKSWLNKLDIEAKSIFGDNFSDTLTEKQWLEDCEDMTVDDIIYENIYAGL
ncbi:MAG: hypothetical protein GY853_16320 [PVC group bacterium]|nr:hypothetical protein [PVC group bacterium]